MRNPPVTADVSIIDCGRGNLRSLAGALDRLGVHHDRARTPEDVLSARRLILPGVGAFDRFMHALRERELEGAIRNAVERGTPLLGICVGMQVLAARGLEHGECKGLGLIDAVVDRIAPADPACRVPHVGWNRAAPLAGHDLLPDPAAFYFVHSYAMKPERPSDAIAVADHGGPIVAAVAREHVAGVQFHPEKSQEAGLELLRRYCAAAA
jgi:glutamine amidotransferase